jgi:hypothetical protein
MERRSAALLKALLVFVACLALPIRASGTTVCVPADMTLGSALNLAQTQAMTIQIEQGTHDLSGTVWHVGLDSGTVIHAGSELLGGYASACTSRNIAVGNTKLVDSVPAASADGAFVHGDLTLEGLTFESGNGVVLQAQVPYVVLGSGVTILLRRNAFIDTAVNAFTVYWGQNAAVGGEIRFVDNLFANNTGPYCFVGVVTNVGAPEVDFINNTVYGNTNNGTGAGACFFNHYSGGSGNATYNLYNNIFYGTAGPIGTYDLVTDDTSVALVNNTIGTRTGPAPSKNKNTLTGDPKLDANDRPIEAPPSPVINSGNNSPPGGLPANDLDGGPRVVGSIVDRGAYESSVDPNPVQTVTNNNDTGAGSLRAAVGGVILNGGGTIKFDIGSGCGPHVITLESDLEITVNATIDGYTQTGASPNDLDVGDDATICVILEADLLAVSPPGRGLVVPSTVADGVSVTIQGLGFSNFSTTGIDLQGGSAHPITGNHFGGSIGGHTMLANGFDVRLAAGTHDDVIGGSDASERNIIGDASGSGVVIAAGSTNNQVINNYIGVGWNPNTNVYTNRANGARGIYVAGDNAAIKYNLIGYNAQAGIVLDSGGAHDNLIAQNLIGSDGAGTNLGNANAGIHLIGASGDAPENNTIRFDIIADNGAQGVLIDVGQGNTVRKNSIYGNALLGIDLGAVGPAFPQTDDGGLMTVDFANRGQNFPILSSASGDNVLGNVTGALTTTPGDYTVDFYFNAACDASGYGQGAVWLGGATVNVAEPIVGDQNTANFTLQIRSPGPTLLFFDGVQITTTATDSLGNTSEFSPCAAYSNDGIFGNSFEEPPA